jgi:hypothetical protein
MASIGADVQAHVEEFVVPAPARPLRAVDLLPGTAAIVRRATISVRTRAEASPAGITRERLVALWVPGDHPLPLDAGMAFDVPSGADLVVRVHYRKTWQHERQAMTDQSAVGLYFAEPAGADVHVLRAFTPDAPSATSAAAGASRAFTTTVGDNVRAIAVYADPGLSDANVTAVAIRPDGSRAELIAFRPRAVWTRRYWFREPITLPRGTRIEVVARFDDALLPPAAARPEQSERSSLSLALNVVRAE